MLDPKHRSGVGVKISEAEEKDSCCTLHEKSGQITLEAIAHLRIRVQAGTSHIRPSNTGMQSKQTTWETPMLKRMQNMTTTKFGRKILFLLLVILFKLQRTII
jgi:hypothetical protein